MLAMDRGLPTYLCDACCFPMQPNEGEALYTTPTQARGLFPMVLLACGEDCSRKAARRLTAGEVIRVPWTTFRQALQKR
jgi:hypothetical protein